MSSYMTDVGSRVYGVTGIGTLVLQVCDGGNKQVHLLKKRIVRRQELALRETSVFLIFLLINKIHIHVVHNLIDA